MARYPSIAVFDSGVGGLTVLRAIQQRLPDASYVYGADQAHFPYGPKSPEEVLQHVHDFIAALTKHVIPDLLVIACGTASTIVLPSLRAIYPFPIVGVVPAIKPAAQLSKSRVIGLLATPGTVVRPYTDQLIAEHAADCHVVRVGSSLLVEMAEAKMRGAVLESAQIAKEIAPLFAGTAAKIDVIVLGCTHFPLLVQELTEAAVWPVAWLDSGEAVASRVAFLVQEQGAAVAQTKGSRLFYTGPEPSHWQAWGFATAIVLPSNP